MKYMADGLLGAIYDDDQKMAIKIIDNLDDDYLVDINELLAQTNKEANTLLHFSIKESCYDVVKILLKRLPENQICLKNKKGFTPEKSLIYKLYSAISDYEEGHENLETLLDILTGEQIVTADFENHTILSYALLCPNKHAINKIFQKLTVEQMMIKDKYGNTSFDIVMIYGNDDIVCDMLKMLTNEDLTVRNRYNRTLLHLAAKHGYCNAVSYILNKLNDKDEMVLCTDDMGDIPLHYACTNGHDKVVDMLLDNATSEQLFYQGKDGSTPLHAACWKNCTCGVLCTEEEPIYIGGWYKHVSCQKNHNGIVEKLLKLLPYEQLNIKDKYSFTPLHCAALKNHSDIIKLFLNKLKKDDIFIEDKNGKTVLDMVTDKKIKLLFEKKLNFNQYGQDCT